MYFYLKKRNLLSKYTFIWFHPSCHLTVILNRMAAMLKPKTDPPPFGLGMDGADFMWSLHKRDNTCFLEKKSVKNNVVASLFNLNHQYDSTESHFWVLKKMWGGVEVSKEREYMHCYIWKV